MKVNENYRVGSLPYEIMAYTHEKEEKTLIKSQDTQNVIGYISRFHIGNQLDLYLNDEQGNGSGHTILPMTLLNLRRLPRRRSTRIMRVR
ncbi:MAG: hypothetical protein ACLVGL_17135 [Waltera sp.]